MLYRFVFLDVDQGPSPAPPPSHSAGTFIGLLDFIGYPVAARPQILARPPAGTFIGLLDFVGYPVSIGIAGGMMMARRWEKKQVEEDPLAATKKFVANLENVPQRAPRRKVRV